MSTIVGKFLNFLLTPLWTYYMPKENGDFGVLTNIYAWVGLVLVILTFGMETTLFRFANRKGMKPDTVFSTGLVWVGAMAAVFALLVGCFLTPISEALHYDMHPEYVWVMATVAILDTLQALPFCYLRFQKRPIKFASLKLLHIVALCLLNLYFFAYKHETEVIYVFGINLACTALITPLFLPDLIKVKWQFDGRLLRQMLSYSWPILILGIAGMLNLHVDKIIFPLVSDSADADVQLSEYGAGVKIGAIMVIITQAFRFAYEPIVFAKNESSDSTSDKLAYYAQSMKWFIIFTLAAFLSVMALIDWLQILIEAKYRVGLKVLPIAMAAEIMMGIYFNLSFWYKLIDKTIWGMWFSAAGCAVVIFGNLYFIPQYGYMACAWSGFAGYAVCMLLSYFVGQCKNPIPYDLKSIGGYTLLAGALYVAMCYVTLDGWMATVIKLLLLSVYLLAVVFSLWSMRLKKMK